MFLGFPLFKSLNPPQNLIPPLFFPKKNQKFKNKKGKNPRGFKNLKNKVKKTPLKEDKKSPF
jgi:hypothetical protein